MTVPRTLLRSLLGAALLVGVASPGRAQGIGQRLQQAARGVTAFAAEMMLANQTVIDLEKQGLPEVGVGAVRFGLSGVQAKDSAGVKLRAYYHNPTGEAVTLPLPKAGEFVLVDPRGRRLAALSGAKFARLPKRATTINVPAMERVELTLLFANPADGVTEATLKVGTAGTIPGIPVRAAVSADAPAATPVAVDPPPPAPPARPAPPANDGTHIGDDPNRRPPMIGGNISAPSAPPAPAHPAATCKVTLMQSAAAPMGRVLATGVPAGADSLYAVVAADGQEVPTVVEPSTGGRFSVVVPLHPVAGVSGGAAELRIAGAGLACAPVELQIRALPAAPAGTARQTVETMSEVVGAISQLFGVTPESLRDGDLKEMAPQLVPVALAYRILDDPSEPNSVRNMLAGTAPLLGGVKPDPRAVDALLQATGAPALVQGMRRALAEAGPLPADSLALAASMNRVLAWRPEGHGGASAFAPRPLLLPASPGCLAICTVNHLSWAMGVQSKIKWLMKPNANDQVSATQTAISVVMSGLAVAGLFNPALAGAAAIAGVTSFGVMLAADGMQNLLPSHLSKLDAQLTSPELPLPSASHGAVLTAHLTAASEKDGWNITPMHVIDLLLQFAPLHGAVAGKLSGKMLKLSPADLKHIEELEKQTVEFLATKLGIANAVKGLVWDGSMGAGKKKLALTIGPVSYGPFDLQRNSTILLTANPGGVLRVKLDEPWNYYPVGLGTTKLTLRTDPKFFNNTTSSITFQVKVRPENASERAWRLCDGYGLIRHKDGSCGGDPRLVH